VHGGEEGYLLGDAARRLRVSPDTLRRWERAGKLTATRDGAGRRRVSREEIERLAARDGAALRPRSHNRFEGVVRSVELGGVIALVEIETGPHLVSAAVTRDTVEELGLSPGMAAVAVVPAASVIVDRDDRVIA
jgi:molybdopterin-binding protein